MKTIATFNNLRILVFFRVQFYVVVKERSRSEAGLIIHFHCLPRAPVELGLSSTAMLQRRTGMACQLPRWGLVAWRYFGVLLVS